MTTNDLGNNRTRELVQRMKFLDVNYDHELSYDEFVTGLSGNCEWDSLLALRIHRLAEQRRASRGRDQRKELQTCDKSSNKGRNKTCNKSGRIVDLPFHLWVPSYHRQRLLQGVYAEGSVYLAPLENRPQDKRWGERGPERSVSGQQIPPLDPTTTTERLTPSCTQERAPTAHTHNSSSTATRNKLQVLPVSKRKPSAIPPERQVHDASLSQLWTRTRQEVRTKNLTKLSLQTSTFGLRY